MATKKYKAILDQRSKLNLSSASNKPLTKSDLWIGEKVTLLSSQRQGVYVGDNPEGKLKIQINGGIVLTTLKNIKINVEPEIDFIIDDNLEENHAISKSANVKNQSNKLNTFLDLHIEILAPHLKNQSNGVILEYQLNACKDYIHQSHRAGLSVVTIIHGIGEGVLKEQIHAMVENDSRIKLKTIVNKGGATELWLNV